MHRIKSKQKGLVFLCLSIAIIASLVSPTYFVFASQQQNKTSMQSQGVQGMATTNTTNIVLVHGAFSDGSTWRKVIPILTDAGHRVIAAQLPLHTLADDVATVKRAIEQLGGPTILVGHSYGGEVITNAGYNNPNVTGLVYIAAIAPDGGETGNDFFEELPKEFSRYSLRTSTRIVQDFCTLIQTNSMSLLLTILIRLKLIPWLLYRSHLTNPLVLKSQVLQPGNSFLHGIRSLRMTALYPLIFNETSLNV